ncbi:MAG: hypothetical protein IH614_09990 [Desulfuromonadales bacterium]|nr:hypothetical protein [Desulfuromonadales bacterium]
MELPTTAERVQMHTAEATDRRIQKEMEMRLWYFAHNPEKIEERLHELDREWDMERTLESNAATLALSGTLLGMMFSRKYLLLPAVVTGFLLQHALQGWCPPVPLFRRMGVRTQGEIEAERYALRALRGDFQTTTEEEPTERIQRTMNVVSEQMPMAQTRH